MHPFLIAFLNFRRDIHSNIDVLRRNYENKLKSIAQARYTAVIIGEGNGTWDIRRGDHFDVILSDLSEDDEVARSDLIHARRDGTLVQMLSLRIPDAMDRNAWANLAHHAVDDGEPNDEWISVVEPAPVDPSYAMEVGPENIGNGRKIIATALTEGWASADGVKLKRSQLGIGDGRMKLEAAMNITATKLEDAMVMAMLPDALGKICNGKALLDEAEANEIAHSWHVALIGAAPKRRQKQLAHMRARALAYAVGECEAPYSVPRAIAPGEKPLLVLSSLKEEIRLIVNGLRSEILNFGSIEEFTSESLPPHLDMLDDMFHEEETRQQSQAKKATTGSKEVPVYYLREANDTPQFLSVFGDDAPGGILVATCEPNDVETIRNLAIHSGYRVHVVNENEVEIDNIDQANENALLIVRKFEEANHV